MGIKRKFFRELMKRSTTMNLLVGAATLLAPWKTEAAVIPQNSSAATVVENGNVSHVYPGYVAQVGDKAYGMGVYKEFNVNQNNIANMYFHTQNSTVEADSLLNLVNSKININGTVNAIRNNQIGGHLYFFSKDGIFVGGTGVINAGALTMATPNWKFFVGFDNDIFNATNMKDYITSHITDINKLDDPTQVNPVILNNAASIIINGRINTYQGTTLRAPFIYLNKADSGTSASENLQACINNNVTNFSDFINIKKADGSVIDALTEANTRIDIEHGSGNIVLAAYANGNNYRSQDSAFTEAVNNLLGNNEQNDSSKAPSLENGEGVGRNNAVGSVVNIGTGAKIINPGGGAIIQAIAVDKPTDTDRNLFGFDIDDVNVLTMAGIAIGETSAEVNVDGAVNAAAVNMTASSTMSLSSANILNAAGLTRKATDLGFGVIKNTLGQKVPILGDGIGVVQDALDAFKVGVAWEHADAKVVIGENAAITSTVDQNINAKATSVNVNKMDTQNTNTDDGFAVSDYVNAVINWTDTDARAKVDIKGKLQAGGKVAANANTSVKLISSSVIKNAAAGAENADTNFAVDITTSKSDAQVTLAENASINAKGDVSLKSNATQSYDTNAAVNTKNGDAAIETAANIVVTDADSKVNIYGAVAGKNINLDAQNAITFNEHYADNAYGIDPSLYDKGFVLVKGTIKKGVGATKDALGKLFLKSAKPKDTKDTKFYEIDDDNELQAIDTNAPKTNGTVAKAEWSDYFDFGMSLAYVDQKNTAEVNIGSQAVVGDSASKTIIATLKAAESLNINANSVIEDSYVRASSNLTDNVATPNNPNNTKALISSAIVYNNADNKANVNIAGVKEVAATEDRPAHVESTLLQAPKVNINANANYEYGRIKSALANIKVVVDQYKSDWENIKEIADTLVDLGEALTKLDNLGNESPDALQDLTEFRDALSDTLKLLDNIFIYYNQYNATKGKTLALLLNDLKHSFDAGYYLQSYAAASTTIPKTNKTQPNALTATININFLDNKGTVNVGDNVVINSTTQDNNGEINIKARAKQTDTSISGRTKSISQFVGVVENTAGDVGLGGTLSLSQSNVKGEVNIGKESQLTAKDITLEGKNDLVHVGLTYGGSKTSSLGITGMVAYAGGSTDSIVNIADNASLRAENNLSLLTNNNTVAVNAVGDFSQGEATSIGISSGVLLFEENSKITVREAELKAKNLEAMAETTGVLTNLSVAGVSSKDKPSAEKPKTNSGGAAVANDLTSAAVNKVNNTSSTDGDEENTNAQKLAEAAVKKNGLNENSAAKNGLADNPTTNNKGGHSFTALDGISVEAAGSASVTVVTGATSVRMDKAYIEAETAKLAANDLSVAATLSGGVALSHNKENSADKFSGNLAGAVAVNYIDKSVTSEINNSNLVVTESLTNEAKDNTIDVALGAALGMDLGGRPSTPGVDAGISGSFNFINSDVRADLFGANVNDVSGSSSKANVTNVAVDNAVQVAGGVAAEYAQSSAAVGANITLNQIDHAVEANIIGGNHKNIGTLANYALSDATQVGIALTGGIVTGSGTNYVTSNSAAAVNIINNTIKSTVKDANIVADKIDVKGFTGNIDTKEINETVEAINNDPRNDYFTATTEQDISFIDWQGTSLADNAGASDVSADTAKLAEAGTAGSGQIVTGVAGENGESNKATAPATSTEGVYTRESLEPHKTGAVQVTGAAALDMNLSNGSGLGLTGGAVVAVGIIKNNVITEVKNNNITTSEANIESWTQEDLVTVAGQANFTKGNGAGGITYAQNDVNNNVKSMVLGNTIDMNGGDLMVKAEDKSNAWTVSVGASVAANQASVAAQGSVAVNTGTKNIAAIVDKLDTNASVINNAGNIALQTFDNISQKAIAGGFAGTNGYGALGAAIATNNIGTTVEDRQTNEARLSNTVLNMAGSDKTIAVKAEDDSELYSFAVGAAINVGTTGAAVDGNAATGVIHKSVEAKGENIKLNTASKTEKLNVEASNDSLIVTSADALGFALSNAGVAGAVAVTESFVDTKASLSGLETSDSKATELKSVLVKAQNKTETYNVGLDAALTVGQGASIVGNFITNRMENHTEACVNDSKLNASGTVGVIAASDETTRNYAGTFAGTDGTGYSAVGASVAVNLLNGDTKASVNESDITALGKDEGLKVNRYQEKDKAEAEKTEEYRKGLVVDADGTRAIYNVLGSIGESIGAQAGVTVFGSVAVNHIGGDTSAIIANTDINKNHSETVPGNVYVDAKDNSKLDSHVALVSAGGGAYAGVAVGGTSNTDLLDRKVKAEVTSDSKNKLYADKAFVHALNHADEFSTLTGLNVGVAIYGSAAVGLNVAVTQHQGETVARLVNMEGKAKSTEVVAERINRAEQYANSAQITGSIGSGSVGVGFAYVDDASTVEATVQGAKLNHYSNNDGDDKVIASNNSHLINEMAEGELAVSIGGGAGILVNVNNIENKTSANVINSELGNTAHAKNAIVNAKNKFAAEFTQVAAEAALGSAGVGVEITTVDSTVTTNVLGSKISAQNLDVKAEEDRSVDATAVAASIGGLAINTNVMVANMGSTVKNEYAVSYIKPDGDHATSETLTIDLDQAGGINDVIKAALAKQSEANDGLENREDLSVKATEKDHLETGLADYKRGGYTDTVEVAADGASVAVVARGVSTNIKNSTLTGSQETNISTNTSNNTNLNIGSGLADVLGLAVDVGVVDITDKSSLTVSENSKVKGREVRITAETAGELNTLTVQAAAGAVNINAAVTDIDRQGGSTLAVDTSQIEADNSLIIKNDDVTSIKAEVQAYALAAGNLGVLVGNANDNANNIIDLSSASLKAGNDITVDSDRRNKVAAKAINVAGNLVGVNAVWLQAENGSYTGDDSADYSKLTVDQDEGFAAVTGANNSLEADSVSVNAYNRSKAAAENTGVEGSLLTSAGYTTVRSTNVGGAKAVLGTNNLKSDSVKVEATTSAESKADVFAVSTGLAGTVTVNEAYARSVQETEAGLDVVTLVGQNSAFPNVDVNANSNNKVASKAEGYEAGGVLASGTNKAMTKDQAFAKAGFTAPTEGEAVTLNKLNITATTNDTANGYANGDGGGIAAVSPEAAYIDNKGYFTADANLQGNINVHGNVAAKAVNNINTQMKAEAIQAGLAQGSGTEGYSHIRSDANVNLDSLKLQNLGSNTASFLAENVLKQAHTTFGNGYGGLSVNVAKLGNYLQTNAAVNVKDNSSVVSAGNIDMAAATRGNIGLNGYVYAVGFVAEDANLDVTDELTTNNQINIEAGTSLKTTALYKNINLSASETALNINSQSVAETENSLLGVASAGLSEKLTRNNKVTVAGELYSLNDIGLYAGKDVRGALGVINIDAAAEAYNKTLIPFYTSPNLNQVMNHDNEIVIASTGSVRSVHNIDLYGDIGQTQLYNRTSSYNYYSNDVDRTNAIITSSGGKLTTAGKNEDKVVVDGTAVAGANNKLEITIGKNGDLIFADNEELNAVKKASNPSFAGHIYSAEEALGNGSITVLGEGNPMAASDLQFGQVDYANALIKRYKELDQLLASYSEDKTKDAYKGYLDEYYRIQNMMVQMNLMDGNGNYLSGTMKVDYVAVPDIVVAGGDITINTTNVSGAGTMKAQGTPEVKITNNTNLLLAVNNISVLDEGGTISYNGQTLGLEGRGSLNEQIKSINLDKNAAINSMTVESAGGYNGKIEISGNYSGKSVNYILDNQSYSFNPKADINIQGLVNSNNGDIKINSAHNNVSVYAVQDNKAAGLSGRSISISAAQGSVTQGQLDGIVNVGGNPENIYSGYYESLIKKINKEHTATEAVDNATYTEDTSAAHATGATIAGESIYIDATDININGILQSGYAKYEANINLTDVQSKLKNLDVEAEANKYNNPDYNGPTDAAIMSDAHYRVCAAKDVFDAKTNSYSRQVEVYYNPYTKRFLVPDIDAHGGQIYLTGRISSTGDGRIVCLDGAYDITVNSNVNNVDLQLGKLISNDVSGMITIDDKAKGTKTVITRDNQAAVLNRDYVKGGYYYMPKTGLRYNWTSGKNMTTKVQYEKETMSRLWGAGKERQENYSEQINQWENDSDTKSENLGYTEQAKLNGATITDNTVANTNSEAFVVIYNNKILDDFKSEPVEESWSTGLFDCHKHYRYTWYDETGSAQSYVGSVKADNIIPVSFIGKEAGKGAVVEANAKGSIYLNDNVGYTSHENSFGSVTLKSENGSIIQETSSFLKGGEVTLDAKDNIKAVANGVDSALNLVASDELMLGAQNHSDGKVLLNVEREAYKEGLVSLRDLGSAGASAVELTAEGNIDKIGTISGHKLDVTSEYGSVNIDVAVGQNIDDRLNVKAAGDIEISSTYGDLRLGTVNSSNGNVSITSWNGNIVDALPNVETDNKDKLKKRLEAAGIISTSETNTELIAKKEAVLAKAKEQGADVSGQYESWSLDKIIYAVEESKINPRAGVVDSGKAANVTGMEITLYAGNNVGQDAKATTTYTIDQLKNDMDVLKTVALANPFSVTWGKDSVTLSDKSLLGVQTRSAEATVNATTISGNIYLEGRSDLNHEVHNTDLKLGTLAAGNSSNPKDIIVTSLGSITSAKTIAAHNLDLQANGNIGGAVALNDLESAQYINTALKGTLSATAIGDIAIYQNQGSLTVGAVSAMGDVYLRAGSDLKMATVNEDTLAQSFIRGETDGNIILKSDKGDLGAAGKELRIENTRQSSAVVNPGQEDVQYKNTVSLLAENGDVYVKGLSSSNAPYAVDSAKPAEGTLYIYDVQAKDNININVNGNLEFVRDNAVEVNKNIDIEADGNISANKLAAVSKDSLDGESSDGFVVVRSKNGGVSVNSINADFLAGVGTGSKGGDIYVGSIRGNAVILSAENAAATIKADYIYAGQYYDVRGNNFELPAIIDGNPQGLTMNVRGTAAKPVVDNYELEIKDGKNYKFGDFWVDKANIKVTDGSVGFDNIMVTDSMEIDYHGIKTSIYGAEPKNTLSQAIYYAPYKAGAGMYLYFDGYNSQRSNGLLLHLDNKVHIYGQRKSVKDLYRKLLNDKAGIIFTDYYLPKLINYNKSDLILDKTKEEAEAEDYFKLIDDGERSELK